MEYRKMMLDDLRKSLDNNEITSEELFNEANKLAHTYQNDINPFVTIIDNYKIRGKKNTILTGIPYSLKDNFSTSNILTTASSNILKNYVPVYDATVYKKLKDAGAVLVGKNVLDELAMGGTGTTGHTGVVKNPWNTKRLIGGSSAGSCASVALGIVPFSIGSDTGDSVRKPAAFGGVVGFKPTYGRISRYGLFAFASSLDHVAMFTRSVRDAAIVTNILKGEDELDMTTLKDDNKDYTETLCDSVKGKKLFYIKEACNIDSYENPSEMLKKTLENFQDVIEKCKSLGMTVEEVSIDENLLNALYPSYMTISCAEATSNNSNLTGIQFGNRKDGLTYEEIMFNTRTLGFSELIKRRFVIGSYVLQKENQEKLFLNACRVRRMITNKMHELFKTYDGLIMPASGGIAPLFGEKTDALSSEYLILENHLCIGNFGGYPSITIPSGFINNMPIAVNITSDIYKDSEVLNMANMLESTMNYKGQIVGDKNV